MGYMKKPLTKGQLIKALEGLSDDSDIFVIDESGIELPEVSWARTIAGEMTSTPYRVVIEAGVIYLVTEVTFATG